MGVFKFTNWVHGWEAEFTYANCARGWVGGWVYMQVLHTWVGLYITALNPWVGEWEG